MQLRPDNGQLQVADQLGIMGTPACHTTPQAMSKETPTTQPPVAARRDTDAIDKVDIDADIKEVEGNLTYLEAVSAAPLNPWSKISIMFYFIFLVAALNATSSGFDGVSHFLREHY